MIRKGSSRVKDRLLFIDVARTFAILLALLAHFIGTFGMPAVFGSIGENYPYITSMATPMFIFMFGFMMEYVYVSKAIESWSNILRKKIYIRSFQCYIGFVLTSLAALAGGHIVFPTFIKSLFMLEATRYGNILLIYSFLLLLMPFFISMRLRFGVIALVLFTVFLCCLTLFVSNYQNFDFSILGYPLNNMFGVGKVVGGPSAIFSLIFVFSGMIVASSLRKCNKGSLKIFYMYLLFFVISILLAIFILNDLSSVRLAKDYLSLYSYGSFRKVNSYNYFLLGTLFSCINIGLICLIFESLLKINSLPPVVISTGKFSLFTFTLGNVVLNLFAFPLYNVESGLVMCMFFTVLIVGARFVHLFPYFNEITEILNLKLVKNNSV